MRHSRSRIIQYANLAIFVLPGTGNERNISTCEKTGIDHGTVQESDPASNSPSPLPILTGLWGTRSVLNASPLRRAQDIGSPVSRTYANHAIAETEEECERGSSRRTSYCYETRPLIKGCMIHDLAGGCPMRFGRSNWRVSSCDTFRRPSARASTLLPRLRQGRNWQSCLTCAGHVIFSGAASAFLPARPCHPYRLRPESGV